MRRQDQGSSHHGWRGTAQTSRYAILLPGHIHHLNISNNGIGGELTPDSAHNNMFDSVAASYLYSKCQKLQIPLVIVTRHAAYSAQIPREIYDKMALTSNPIG